MINTHVVFWHRDKVIRISPSRCFSSFRQISPVKFLLPFFSLLVTAVVHGWLRAASTSTDMNSCSGDTRRIHWSERIFAVDLRSHSARSGMMNSEQNFTLRHFSQRGVDLIIVRGHAEGGTNDGTVANRGYWNETKSIQPSSITNIVLMGFVEEGDAKSGGKRTGLICIKVQ